MLRGFRARRSGPHLLANGKLEMSAASKAMAGQGSPPASSTPAARQSVIQLVFRDTATLYAAYMPTLVHGGLFVPTTRSFRLGEEVLLLVALPDDPARYPVVGTVAWITPAKAAGGRPQGVGVHLPGDEKTQALRLRIEEILGTALASSKPTQTL